MSNFTQAQQRVIDFNEGNLVVSASAGSGKTTVMVERIIRLICENKCNVDEILAVTFTKLSAKEMKEKISTAIKKKIASGGDKQLLKAQLDKLQTASISTVHSFCANLIRTYFYTVGIDPLFTILDDADATELKNRAIDDVFESLYENDDKGMLALLDIFISRRNDAKMRELVLNIFEFASSEEDIDLFLEKSLSLYTDEGYEKVVNRLIDMFYDGLDQYIASYSDILEKSQNLGHKQLEEYYAKYGTTLISARKRQTPRLAIEELKAFTLRRSAVRNKSYGMILVGEKFDSFKESFKKFIEKFEDIFFSDEQQDKAETLSNFAIVKSLVDVVRLFIEKYTEIKRMANVLDYSDLEHLTLQVLSNEETRNEIASRYKYIFVDEYQDTNGIQEGIFSRLERNNLFIVGDVKQSIYAFRGCNPQIFKAKIDACENGDYGTHISLDSNFRSSKAVIDATNNVFSAVMHEKNCGNEYCLSPMTGGTLYGEYLGNAFYHETEDVKEYDNIGVYSVKKHLGKLKEIKATSDVVRVYNIIESEFGKEYYDIKAEKEEERVKKIGYGDITILTRNNKGLADRIVSYLAERGIPVVCQSARTIKEYPEIKLMINLLEFISSPTKDIPLATVLKSPIGGLSNNQLSEIRKFSKDGSFFDACMRFAESGKGLLSEKLVNFFEYFDKIRVIAQFETVEQLVKRIIKERGFELKILSNKLGQVKMTRINRFILAGKDLMVNEFLSKIDSLTDSLTMTYVQGDDAVKIMSYHSSKGLEFPVVIIPDVSKQFNTQDSKGNVILDREWGIALKNYSVTKKVAKKNNIRRLFALNKSYGIPSEEMRLLYVAMTRAKYKLHIIAETKKIKEFHAYENYAFAIRMSDFLASSDMARYKSEELTSTEIFETVDKENRRNEIILATSSQDKVDEIKSYLQYSYPYENDTHLHLKRTVTGVVKALSTSDESEVYFESRPIVTVDPREVGNAYHKFLELFDFEKSVDNELIRILNEGRLTQEESKFLSKEKLESILNLNVFKLIKGAKLYKEQPFILNVPSLIAGGGESEEQVLLQGTIDLLAITDSGAFVIDYKHSSKSDESLVNTYKKQLELYAFAVEKISGLKVLGTYLVNLNLVREIKL